MSETERESKQEKNVEGGWSLFKSFQWYFCCAPCYAKNRRGEKQCVSFFSVVVFCVHTERGARVFFLGYVTSSQDQLREFFLPAAALRVMV